jgi:hypothetical protein
MDPEKTAPPNDDDDHEEEPSKLDSFYETDRGNDPDDFETRRSP